MDNKMMLYIALGIGAYALFARGGEKKYIVPGVGLVAESLLPDYGYQKINGFWYSQAQIDAAAAQAGVPSGTTVQPGTAIFNTIMNILATSIPLITNVVTQVTNLNRTLVITQILSKYTNITSSSYNALFPYNKAQLEAMTNAQLQNILNTGAIAGINYTCSDAGRDLSAGSPFGGTMLNHCRWGTSPKK